MSEMYFRLVRCVYRKYCERIKIEFQESKFLDVLKRVGKVAWKMWKSGKGWAKKSEILKEVGEDAFEIGLLIGHRDFRLSRDETADILITFPHQTILEFLGSFGFLQMLQEGHSIEAMFDNDQQRHKVMQNLPFLQFCLWFLEGSCAGGNFKFGQDIYESIVCHCANEINLEQLDMLDIAKLFPVLKVPFVYGERNRPLFKFIQAVLSKCDKTREFYLHSISYYPGEFVSQLLPSLPPIALKFSTETDRKSLTILERASNYGALRKVLDSCEAAGLKICLFLLCDTDVDLSTILHSSLEKISLCGHPQSMPDVISGEGLRIYPFLREFSVVNARVHCKVFHSFQEIDKFPSLSRLHFERFQIIISENARKVDLEILHLLFSSQRPLVTHLTLDFHNAFTIDKKTFERIFLSEENKWFPTLSSLVLHTREGFYLPFRSMFQSPQPTIRSLKLQDVTEEDYEAICFTVNNGNLPNLSDLHFTMQEPVSTLKNRLVQGLVNLLTYVFGTQTENKTRPRSVLNWPTLTNLTFNKFVTSPSHLNTIVVSVRGSNVSTLDISHSKGITGRLSAFLSHGFPFLDTLILSDCGLNSGDLISLSQAGVEGRLPELKHLDLSENTSLMHQCRHLFSYGQQWDHLLSLDVKQDVQFHDDYHDLVHAVRLGALPKIQRLSLSTDNVVCLQNCLSITWPRIQNFDIRYTFKRSSNEHVQVFHEVTAAIERGSLPELQTLSVTSEFVPNYLENCSLNDIIASLATSMQLHDLSETCSSLLTTSTETNESYLNYLQGLQDVTLVKHLA